VSNHDVSGSLCAPLTIENGTDRAFFPCGLIANSMFNDTFSLPVLLNTNSGESNRTYNMSERGIAWEADKTLYGNTRITDFERITPPPYWQVRYPDGRYSQDAPPPNLQEDEHFMVWMRTAGLPSFSKLYSRNDNEAMTNGTYELQIIDNFRTDVYQGKKKFLFTQVSPMGGHNNFLGILWLVVGAFCIVLAVVFLITNFIKPRKLGDHTYLSWNNTPASAAAKGKGKVAGGPAVAMSTGRDM
jgi:hypothetical protein